VVKAARVASPVADMGRMQQWGGRCKWSIGKKRITGETALQLAEALGTSAELWMRLEADHELNRARLARQLHGVAARARGATRAGLARHAKRSAAR
jgi:hypothetical protein